MTSEEIRARYLGFFEARGHVPIEAANLVPRGDGSTLFVGSGMQPLVTYLLGEEHPLGGRLVDSQPCLRADDLDEVGDGRHTTFFEMLGNWSLGEYFKAEQLGWIWEFLTTEVGLDQERLYISVFGGEKELGLERDQESATKWQEILLRAGLSAGWGEMESREAGGERGMKAGERIFFYGASKNWWSRYGEPQNMPAGEPGGPDSEIFYDFGIAHDSAYGKECHPNCECGRFVEIGNSVFMEYRVGVTGDFERLAQPNVDFGGGLERMEAASIASPDVFQTEVLAKLIKSIEVSSGKSYAENARAMRIVADHLRGAVFLVGDGVIPSNKEQGSVLRRLIRRALRQGLKLGVQAGLAQTISQVVIEAYKTTYPQLRTRAGAIEKTLADEETIFRRTLNQGVRIFPRLVGNELTGAGAFQLFDTYGFPFDLSVEEAKSLGVGISPTCAEDFAGLMRGQKERSRQAAKEKTGRTL